MNRNQKGSKRRLEPIHLWTHSQVRDAVPYISSVLRSLREGWLDAQQHDLRAKRLAARPGRPDRAGIMALDEARREHERAEARYHEALQELHNLDVYSFDPIGGLALIPFAHDKQLAWFVFDLFDAEPVRFWRYHGDSLDERRPVEEVLEGPAGKDLVV